MKKSNKKALIKKEKSFRQSFENQIKMEKKKRNTRSAEAFLCLACLHPRTHPCSCLSFRFYSFRAVYINSNRLSRTIFSMNVSNPEKRTVVHINERKPELFHIYSCKQTFFQSQDKLHNYAATCDINHKKMQFRLDLTAFLQNGSEANNFRKKQIIYCIEIA